MTLPRKALVCVDDTPFYHVTSRCVRRSFLCGVDHATGHDYSHRRLFIEQRIHLLSTLFAIDIAAYAVMSNHLHLVVKLSPEIMNDWSDREVLERWTSLHKGSLLVQRYLNGTALSAAELAALKDIITLYRLRLADLGWFMKCLNEPIARMANKEDGCRGHFWEARYRSQALLTDEALLTCMAYVDLNPIRADMAASPEESQHTSIKERINPSLNLSKTITDLMKLHQLNHFNYALKPLLSFDGNITDQEQHGILFNLNDYLELVDHTGRALRNDKRGAIALHLPPILERLGIDRKAWLNNATAFEQIYRQRFAKRPKRQAANNVA
ncbi:transposase [uncultured Zhongshania sp.]|jgi:REP element-mobilizing transposase RayT|uniref:transposase n=1 Tax=uncultured Zhongshania sp. TaxID=1642288 RepID=UPI0025D4EA45|nr:transposase [uncultured Zhongshania sp.]